MLRIERVCAEPGYGIVIHHAVQIVIVPDLDLLHLVGGAEAVEEVQHGYASLDSRHVSNGAQVHDLLRIGGRHHRVAGGTACHNVGVVAENAQGVGCHSSRGDVDDIWELLGCNFEHIWDHEQKPLRGCICSRQSA